MQELNSKKSEYEPDGVYETDSKNKHKIEQEKAEKGFPQNYLRIAGLIITALLIVISFLYLKNTGYYRQAAAVFSSQEAFREYVSGFEGKAPSVFFLFQVIQVLVSPIPGALTTIAGGSLFGLTGGFLLNTTSILTGSLLAFILTKRFGKSLVIKLVGEDTFNKYYRLFTGKYTIFLLLVFLFPFFPDDLFCFLAGLSTLPLRVFLMLLIFGRLPVIFIQTLLGTRMIESGPAGWAILLVVLGILMYFLIKYKERIEGFFLAEN